MPFNAAQFFSGVSFDGLKVDLHFSLVYYQGKAHLTKKVSDSVINSASAMPERYAAC